MKIGIFYDHPKNYKGGFNYIVNLINCLTFQNKIITIILFCDPYHFYEFKKNLETKMLKLLNYHYLIENIYFFIYISFWKNF